MSPVSLSRYRVTLVDFDAYDIIIEALDAPAAIKKAKRIYHLNGQGLSFEADVAGTWSATALLQEVQQ
jgi:hypothetical protein